MSYETDQFTGLVSSASLATALAPYLTSASASAAFVTSASLATTLATYITSSSLATALGPYLTSASAALSTYITSASLATALGPYLTSASAALSTYVTSSSLATALGPYLTSASADLGTYVTSNSLSAAVATDALTVRGNAYVSASLSVGLNLKTPGYATLAGGGYLSSTFDAFRGIRIGDFGVLIAQASASFSGSAKFVGPTYFEERTPVVRKNGGATQRLGAVLLGTASLPIQSVRFSGSWTNIGIFELVFVGRSSGASNTSSVALYTDGGTTPFFTMGAGTLSTAAHTEMVLRISDLGGTKSVSALRTTVATTTGAHSATANAGVVNCIQFAAGASVTLSSGHAYLLGWYTA